MWTFKPKDVFAVNPNLKVEVHHVLDSSFPVVTIDNFYKRPDLVRDLILQTPAPIWKENPEGSLNFVDYLDCRHYLRLDLGEPCWRIRELAARYLGVEILKPVPEFVTNVFKWLKEKELKGVPFPHSDHEAFAALVYLNTEEECRGGTAFYKNKALNSNYMIDSQEAVDKVFIPENKEDGTCYFHERSDEFWEAYSHIPMAYNRLLMYPGRLFHGSWQESSWFRDYYRINQVFFFPDIRWVKGSFYASVFQ